METLSLVVIIFTIYSGLYYQAAASDKVMESNSVTWLVFCSVLIPSIVFAINFVKRMWIEILKIVAGKSSTAFRYFTCGSEDLAEFKKKYMHENEVDDDL